MRRVARRNANPIGAESSERTAIRRPVMAGLSEAGRDYQANDKEVSTQGDVFAMAMKDAKLGRQVLADREVRVR